VSDTPMFVCGPTTGCGRLTLCERTASGWRAPQRCAYCGNPFSSAASEALTVGIISPAPQ
jgi:hypothetical protein